MRRGLWIVLLAATLTASVPAVAGATWKDPGAGSGYSKANALASGATPSASVSGRSVTVSWIASGGAVPVAGYVVKRYDTNGQAQTVGSACSGTVSGLTCTEDSVPAGEWRYSVAPVNNNWRGAESAQSASVTVGSPSLTLGPATVTALPATLTGQIANFIGGQTVTFRLDNPSTGTVLSGSIAPSPVPGTGTASASVTIPVGTANGAHTVYAVGSGGDTASAPVNLAVTVTSTVSTSAWDLRDASAGTGEVNQSDTSAFANDGRSAASGNFMAASSTSRYVQYTYNSPLAPGNTTSSVNFNLNYAGTASGDTTCFYFDVRRASTGTVIGTHGSAGSPVDCTTGTTFKATTTSLSEVTSTEIADDLQIRVYVTNSGKHPINVDLATVSGTALGQAFTLYESSFVDSASGIAGAAVPWSLYGSDSAFYASAGSWATTFSTTRYLKLSFPSYVPSTATVNSVTFKHAYRSVTSGANVCYYFEVYSGSTLIGTHGSSSTPVSCNSSNATWQTDTVSLPEVTSAAAADNLIVKLYADRSSSGKSQHDLSQLQLTFTQ
jgi:hypothetical protein